MVWHFIYHEAKTTNQKSWTRFLAFNFARIPLEKGMNLSFMVFINELIVGLTKLFSHVTATNQGEEKLIWKGQSSA